MSRIYRLQETFPIKVTEEFTGNGIRRWVEVLHSVITRNYVYYPPEKLQGDPNFTRDGYRMPTGIYSLLSPYPKPFLLHHNELRDAIGRFVAAKFAESTSAGMPGVLGLVEVTDPEAIQKIRDGRYYNVSAGIATNAAFCSICGINLVEDPEAYRHEHFRGQYYDGKLAYIITGDLWFDEVSVVNVPGDIFAHIRTDEEESTTSKIFIPQSFAGPRLSEGAHTGTILTTQTQADEGKEDGDVPEFDESLVVALYEGATSYSNLPLGPRDRAWNASRAIGRVRKWAGGPEKEKINWTQYRKAFFWYDSSNPEDFGSYKLPFADVINGRLMAIPRGIFAAAQRLESTQIPAADKEKVRRHIARYYAKMGEKPPWARESYEERIQDALADMNETAALIAWHLLEAQWESWPAEIYEREKARLEALFEERGWKLPQPDHDTDSES